MGVRVLRINLQRIAIRLGRTGEVLGDMPRHADVVMRFGDGGIQRERLLVVDFGLFVVAHSPVNRNEVHVGLSVLGIDLQGIVVG